MEVGDPSPKFQSQPVIVPGAVIVELSVKLTVNGALQEVVGVAVKSAVGGLMTLIVWVAEAAQEAYLSARVTV